MELTRKLGFWETTCKFGHDYFAGTSNVVMRANILGRLDILYLQQALQILYHRHPILRATIQEQHRELFFFYGNDFSKIPCTIIQQNTCDDWPQVVETEMLQQFQQTNYLWRVKILNATQSLEHVIIVTFHHAIADGLSTANFMHELLSVYAELEKGITPTLGPLPALGSVEQLLRKQNEWSNFLHHKKVLKEQAVDIWAFSEFKPLTQRCMRNIYVTLAQEEVQALLYQARQENTTINSALNAAMLLSAQALHNTSLSTMLHTPIDLRHYCMPTISAANIGCYISMVTTVHQQITAETAFWQLARDYRSQLLANIPNTGFCPGDFSLADFDVVELIHLFDMPGSTKRRYFSSGFGISNLGELKLQTQYGSLALKYFMFCTNHVMGEYIIFCHVVTLHGKMQICFSFAEPLIAANKAEIFVAHFTQCLKYNMRGVTCVAS